MLRRRRQKPKEATQSDNIPEGAGPYHAEKSEMDSASRTELDATQSPYWAGPVELSALEKLRSPQEMR